jgi:hypothetical protein
MEALQRLATTALEMDFHGQKLAENMYQGIIIVFSVRRLLVSVALGTTRPLLVSHRDRSAALFLAGHRLLRWLCPAVI